MVRSAWLSERCGGEVWLKLESLQVANSFKSRGAFNAVMALLERGGAPARLVTASAGNHGRALAAAAETFGLPLVVFTPANAPATKLDAIRRHGATLRAEARDYDEAEKQAKEFASKDGGTFISPYNDDDVIAGAATVATEMFEEVPEIETLVVPIGGGGLISGVAVAATAVAPACEIVGIEVAASNAFQVSVRAGRLVEIVPGETIADGLGGNPDPETVTFGYIKELVDRIDTVTEEELSAAIAGLVEHEHLVAEGAGAAAVAALIGGRAGLRGGRIAAIVSGSNIDRTRLTSILGRASSAPTEAPRTTLP
jgi:threonine dehydratase